MVDETITADGGEGSARREFLGGVRAELPILLGVIPFGMIYGVLAIAAGLPPVVAQAMSSVVFAGSSQFIATQLIATGASGLIIVLTIAIVNLRHALYSASLAPCLEKLRPAWKWLLAYLLTDEAYAVAVTHYYQDKRACDPCCNRHWYFLGAGLALWSSWQLSTAAGIFLGSVVPPSWQLDFTLALTFIALLVPTLKDRPGLSAALSAGVLAVALAGLPYRLGLIFAALVGVAVGMWSERYNRKKEPA